MKQEKIEGLVNANFERFQEIRNHLHQYPELSFEEHNTATFIEKQLKEWGIESIRMGKTGVIALLEGKGIGEEVIALRADIDALPIQEENKVPYCSSNPGVMHACGHDVHTTCLLGAAFVLKQLEKDWGGTIKLIFQPGEEMLPGGASVLIKEGVLENPKPTRIIGQHVEPLMPAGQIGIKPGIFMASADELHITVKGKGGHGARPHQCVDTILMAAQLVVQLQQIVSRNTDPLIPSVLTLGKIYSEGGATNIIPSEVKILGTFRTFDEAWRKIAHQKMKKMAELLCESMGGECDFNVVKGYPFVENNIPFTEQVRAHAENYLGKEKVVELPARMGGEDFGFYAQEMPACFYRLGVGNPNKTGLHTPTFDINPTSLKTGIGLMTWVAIKSLEEEAVTP
jgi:amidohydrolase